MKSFSQYINYKLQELAAYNVGQNILGQSSLDDKSEKAITAAMQAFELVMSKNSQAASQFLNRMSVVMPEIKAILQQHGLDSFTDGNFRMNAMRAAKKGKKIISKGLADVSTDDVKDGADVIATNSADSFHNPIG